MPGYGRVPGAPSGASVRQQATAPLSPAVGDLWVDTDDAFLLGQSTTLVTASTVAETELLNGGAGFVIPANTLQVGDVLTLNAHGTELNNSGGTIAKRWRGKGNATVATDTNTTNYSTNAAERRWFLNARIQVVSLTSELFSGLHLGSNAASDTAPTLATSLTFILVGSAAENLASDLTLSYTVAFASAPGAATCNVKCLGSSLMLDR